MTLASRLTATFTVVLALVVLFAPVSAEGQGSIESDRAALVALYDATGGANWNNGEGWRTDRPLREWFGVTTAADGRVTELELITNNLTGEIPRELGDLTNLDRLLLNNNNLTGEIPRELGSLTNLTELWLGGRGRGRGLTGEIPREFGSLTDLELLVLNGNNLTGEIPRELGSLMNLTDLYLALNNLTGEIPRELGGLTKLERLSFGSNNLTGEIPRELGSLTRLNFLSLGTNSLTGEIPRELDGLTNLTRLLLRENDLTGEIPRELGSLTDLEFLHLHNNRLTGEIPRELARFEDTINPQQSGVILPIEADGTVDPDRAALEALYDATGGANWRRNTNWKTDAPLLEWEGVQANDANRVRVLRLADNNLAGPIPRELGNLTDLRTIEFQDNNLTGEIPRELGDLTNLEFLNLQRNNLTGEIPRGLGGLDRLVALNLHDNDLTGGIPRELGSLTSLGQLNLNDNNLTGGIPRELGDLANLGALRLHNNNLTGGIPRELGSLTGLRDLRLHNNNLTGEIPRELARFEDTINPQQNGVILPVEGEDTVDPVDSAADKAVLEAFFDATGGANWNNNEGWKTDRPLSEWFGVTAGASAAGQDGTAEIRVTGLSLADNNLTGQIPRELADLPQLAALVLTGNNLTGTIPEELRRFENTINPQQGGVDLPVGTPVPALPFVAALLLGGGLWYIGRRRIRAGG